jgi:hypothetical protein
VALYQRHQASGKRLQASGFRLQEKQVVPVAEVGVRLSGGSLADAVYLKSGAFFPQAFFLPEA